jgi:small-conductance mechanosensitive channel/predicted  nucleic acid-binding Zn-ribbon protein
MKKISLGFVCTRYTLITALLVVIFCTCIPVDAEEKLELYNLDNTALIEKAATLFNAIEPVLKAQERALQHDVQRIDQLEKRLARTTPLEALPKLSDTPTPEELEKRIGEIENQHQTLKRNTPILEEKKTLLDQQRKRVAQIRQAFQGWLNGIGPLKSTVLEIQWRLEDGTLTSEQVPEKLADLDATQNRQNHYERELENLQVKRDAIQKELENLKAEQEQLDQAITATEVMAKELTDRIQQTQQSINFEKKVSGQPIRQLASQHRALTEEHDGDIGIYYLIINRFNRLWRRAQQLAAELESQKPPSVEEVSLEALIYYPVKTQTYAKALGARVAFHAQEIEELDEVKALYEKAIQQRNNIEVKNGELADQFTRLRTFAKLIDERRSKEEIPSGLLPVDYAPEVLEQNAQDVASLASEALAAAEKIKASLPAIEERIKIAHTAHKGFLTKQETVRTALAYAENREKQKDLFQDLKGEELIEKLNSSSQSLAEAQENLSEMRKQVEHAAARVAGTELKLHSNKGPLFAATQQEMMPLLKEIRVWIYGLAGIKLPEEQQEPEAASAAAAPLRILKKWGDEPDQPLGGLITEMLTSQDLLSSHIQFFEENRQQEQALLNALQIEKRGLEEMIETLNNALLSARQIREGAIEVQKRVGRRQIQPDQVPPNLDQLMDRTILERLQREFALRQQRINRIEERLAQFAKREQTQNKLPRHLNDLIGVLGSKIRVLQDRDKYLASFAVAHADWSESERKNLTQEAIRRLAESQTRIEYLLTFFASERGKALTEILQEYFAEVIKLEKRLKNLSQQEKAFDRLLNLSQKESPIMAEILPLLREKLAALELDIRRSEAHIRMQLTPKKAAEIQKQWEKETGKILSIPTPFDEKNKKAAIDEAIERLFEKEVKRNAIQKWIALFENRHSRFGLQSEMGIYQGEIGDIKVRHKALERQVNGYIGFPAQDIRQIQALEGDLSDHEMERLQLGEIGITRADSFQVQQKAAILAVGKFFAIILIAFFLIRAIEIFLWRRLENKAGQAIPHLVRGMVAFIIYTVAFFMIVAFVFGKTITGLLATSGVLAMVIGLAIQMNISNIFSGLAINLERPFKIGDLVRIDGHLGRVENMNWRTTRIRSVWNWSVTIPNHQTAETVIMNYSGQNVWQGGSVYLPPGQNPGEMERLLTEILERFDIITEPWVIYAGFNDWAADYWVYYLVPFAERNTIKNKVHSAIWQEFNQRGIKPMLKKYHNVS